MRLTPPTRPAPEMERLRDELTARRGGVRGPFQALVHSPRLCEHVEALSTYCMRDSALPPRLRELTLLIAARTFDAEHSWLAHVDKAVGAGVDRDALQRLAQGLEPAFARADEQILHRFSVRLLTDHFVDDDTYAAARAELGERALVDLVASLGTFATLAMVLNTFQVDRDSSKEPPFPDIRDFGHRIPPPA